MYAGWLQPAEIVVSAVLQRLQESARQSGWSTGLDDLDSVTGGLQRGALWALTSRPGAGKSLLALGLARCVAQTQGERVLVVSRRETAEELGERIVSAEARVGLHHMRQGPVPDDDWGRLEAARSRLVGMALHLGQAAVPVKAVLGLERKLATEPPQLIVVDDIDDGPLRLDQLRNLHGLACRLHCAVVAVLAADSREPGAAEEEAALVADVVMRVENCSGDRLGQADLVVTHNRRGPVSRIVLENQMHYARFMDPLRAAAQRRPQ